MMKRRGELRLIQQALNNGWNITRQGCVDAMTLVAAVLADPLANDRERIRACKIVMLMEAANLEIEIDEQLLSQVRAMGVDINARIKNER